MLELEVELELEPELDPPLPEDDEPDDELDDDDEPEDDEPEEPPEDDDELDDDELDAVVPCDPIGWGGTTARMSFSNLLNTARTSRISLKSSCAAVVMRR